MKLSTRVRYGCRAMVHLALRQTDTPVALELLAHEECIPERYLAKIIQDLRRSGLIRSVRGAHGGYALSRAAETISLLDVWEALEGPFCPVDCVEHPQGCDRNEECLTRDVWVRMRDAMTGVLQSVTLASLAKKLKPEGTRAPRPEECG